MRVIGATDEQTYCDKCGREELRGTVILGDDNGQEVGRYGSTCAARVLNQKPATVTAARKSAFAQRDRLKAEAARIAATLADPAKAARWAERGILGRESARLAEVQATLNARDWMIAA